MFNRKLKARIAELEMSNRALDERAEKLWNALEGKREEVGQLKRKLRTSDGALQDVRADLANARVERDSARKGSDDLMARVEDLKSKMERGRTVLVEWRDSDPDFAEIIQDVIDEYDTEITPPVPWKDAGEQRLQKYFGLSRASWSVLPRVTLQAMPDLWKYRFAALMVELDNRFPNFPDLDWQVRAKGAGGKFVPIPEAMTNYRYPDRDALKSWGK